MASEPRPPHELKAAIYDGRVETYDYAPLFDELATLANDSDTAGTLGRTVVVAGAGTRNTPVVDAVAGVVHVLAGRRDSWDTGRRPVIRRPVIRRPVIRRPVVRREDIVRSDVRRV